MDNESGVLSGSEGVQNKETPPAAPPADPSGGSAPADWLAGLSDEARGVADAKGWKSPDDAISSYKNLESLFGQDKAGRTLTMPKDAEDAAAYDKIYAALGRPESAEGYDFGQVFEGEALDANFVGGMSKAMHDSGLSKAQAHKMAQAYKGIYDAAMAGAEKAFREDQAKAVAAAPPEKLEMARRAFRMFDLSEDEAAGVSRALDKALGAEKAISLFAALGARFGEDKLGGLPDGGYSRNSPQGAERRMAEKMADPAFLSRYMANDPFALAEMESLAKTASAK